MFGERSQQRIPSLVTDRHRLIFEKSGLSIGWFPAVLFEEFPHQLPSHLGVSRPHQSFRKIGKGHWAIARHNAPAC